MALVDYSSSESDDEEEAQSPAVAAKRQKTSHDVSSAGASSTLPPLPAAFHNLYASTVRVSTGDDPTLHQGRKRVNPHKAGSWPSHLYIEWHPTASQHALLSNLLAALRPALPEVRVTSFLLSDLGAPQPLHVSLSRPIVLGTAQKDEFLEQLVARIASCGVSPFDLAPRGLEWHRTRESGRSFLVLRVGRRSSANGSGGRASGSAALTTTPTPTPTTTTGDSAEGGVDRTTFTFREDPAAAKQQRHNPELSRLLQRCNALVEQFQQPPLYASRDGNDGDDDAFHISIAWSFAEPTPEARRRTERVFSAAGTREEVLAARIPVDGIKAKIGNVVTHIPLPARGRRGRED
ncbi:hypothetical protein Hte_012104 [Hypoxylon texense]